MKIINWNVNGLRACLKKGLMDFITSEDPDIMAFEEIKMTEDQLDVEFEGYYRYMNSAERKGYSGTMVLSKIKPVIYTGDLNVANEPIDLKNPDTNHFNAGFSDEERAKFKELLKAGFVDTYRELYPLKVEYSWWSYRMRARERNIGWRIDYFVVSERLMEKVEDSIIMHEVFGSDHCPVKLLVNL